MGFTPLYDAKPKNVRDTLSGRFVPSGKQQTADVLLGAGVEKRMMSQTELQRRKKLQSKIAVTTSTLGLGALALKGGSVAAGAKAARLTKLAEATEGPHAAVHEFHAATWKNRSQKLNNAALNTGIVSSGIGGLGGYNFASYTKAESKQKVKKNQEHGMDFGLGSVHQGEVSKGWGADSARKATEVARKADLKSRPLKPVSQSGDKAARSEQEHYQRAWRKFTVLNERSNAGAKISPMRSRSFAPLEHALPGYGGRTGSNWEFNGNKRVRKAFNSKITEALVSGAAGGTAGALPTINFKRRRKQAAKRGAETRAANAAAVQTGVAKADWMNISEHQRRGRDSRRTAHRAANVANLASVAGGGALIHAAYGNHKYNRNGFEQAFKVGRAGKNAAQMTWNSRGMKQPMAGKTRSTAGRAFKSVARANPHGTAALASYGTAAAALGVAGGARINEKRHDRAITRLRRERAIEKAYDPERNRQRRLDHWSTASAVGAGAAGTGALMYGKKAVKGGVIKLPKNPVFGRGVRSAGKAGALGVTAAGLAIGSDRIRSYKKGRGRSYTPMHTIAF